MMTMRTTSAALAAARIVTALVLTLIGTSPIAAALVGHWSFDGHFDDAIGGHHATVPAPPSGSNNVYAGTDNGKLGGAAVFDGSNDALVISRDVLPSGTGAFSLAFWEFSPAGSTNQGYFLGAGGDTDGLRDIFLRRFTRGDDRGTRYAGNLAGGTFGEFRVVRGVWHFNVVTNDADGNARWYVDGDVRATQTSTFDGLTGDLWLGNRKRWDRDFLGAIDDLGIWHEPLPVERIRAVQNVANWASLHYNLGETQQLFDVYDAGPGAQGTVGAAPWRYVSDLNTTAQPGTVLRIDGRDTLILGDAPGSRSGVASMAPSPPSMSLVGHWTFDGHFEDAIGGHHATAPSPPGGANNVYAGADNGMIGGAAVFDGNNDALRISRDVLPPGTDAFTLAFWEFSPAGSSNDGYFLAAGAGDGFRDVYLRRYQPGGNYAGGFNADVIPGDQRLGEFAVPRGEWHFNVVTQDAQGNAEWHVDGVLRATQAAFLDGLTGDLWLGNRNDWNRDFYGLLDDLGIWHGVLPPERMHAIENLARWEPLQYNLGQAQQLFDIFEGGPGTQSMVGGMPWRYASGIEADDAPGIVLEIDGWDFLILDGVPGNRIGVQMIPEPGAWLLLLSAVAGGLLVRRRRAARARRPI